MARKQSVSVEVMLEQALVPESEQPYKVPENWVWTRLHELVYFIGGGTPSKSVAAFWNGDIPWASVKDIKGDYLYETIDKIAIDGLMSSASNRCEINDLILVTRIEPGKTIISKIQAAINQDLKIVKSKLSSNLLHFFFINCKHEIMEKSSGSTVLGIKLENIELIKFPLPPLAEQQRIVEQVKSLFSKLDEAKEKVQIALDSFESRKAAILHKAFTGELTKKWRKKSGEGFERDWEEKKIEQISNLITKGASPSWQGINYVDDTTQTLFITSENVREGFLDLTREKYVENQIKTKQKRSCLKKGDVLVNIVGASIGRAAIFNINTDANINQAVCLIRLNENASSKYLCYYLNSPEALKYYAENKVDVARANLSLKDIGNISIPMPPLPEQKEVVRILDSTIEKEQKAKELSDVMGKIDLMKKAILARAFRGELGTNDPEEESAKELLKSILADKINSALSIKEESKAKKKKSVLMLGEINVPKTILEVLREYKSLTPEKLKAQTGIMDIDDFYAELKNLVEAGAVIERREGDESYLEVNDAGRQA
jgi:Restriction endonuclease S subunits